MDDSGKTNRLFGGGGIYVNGTQFGGEFRGANGELYLKNVVVTNNTSKKQGAGYAACPVSKTKFYVTEGGAIYGNQSSESNVHDLFLLSHTGLGLHSGETEFNITPFMLGGNLYKWRYANGIEVPLNELTGTLYHDSVDSDGYEFATLGFNAGQSGDEKTQEFKKVIISGNYSGTRGGGIGSNGTVIFGTEDTTKIIIDKKWFDEDGIEVDPNDIDIESVEVEIWRTDADDEEVYIELVTISKEDGWHLEIDNLPKADDDGNEYKYFVKEKSVKGYEGTVKKNDDGTITIENHPSDTSIFPLRKNGKDRLEKK